MIKVLSLFSGIGAFEKALENLQIKHEVVAYCEIDKYASKAYSLIHKIDESKNLGDISRLVSEGWHHGLPDCDLVTYGFPCQDISVAGKQAGISEETRSGLLRYALEIIKEKKPMYAICENVKNLVGKKFRKDFDNLLAELESYGYVNHWKVLNAKDYGIPQNRERVFVVSIRKDVPHDFQFPLPFDNGLRLVDILEEEVDEKYYISQEKCEKLLQELNKGKGMSPIGEPSGIYLYDSLSFSKDALLGNSRCLKAKIDASVVIPVLTPDRLEKRQNGRRFKTDGEPAFTVNTQDRHGVLQRVGLLDIKGNKQVRRVYSTDGISPTLDTMQGGNRQPKIITLGKLTKYQNRIRKLTPLECFRLMAFSDNDFSILKQNNISDSQIYKMAGNSICVNVLEEIFKNLLIKPMD